GRDPAHVGAPRDLPPRRQGAPDPLRSALLAVPLIAGATFGSEGRSEREALVDLRPETAVPGRRQAEEDALVAHLPELLVGGVVAVLVGIRTHADSHLSTAYVRDIVSELEPPAVRLLRARR